jgi:uncharacterized protein with GYD domain
MQRYVITMKLTHRGVQHVEGLPQFCDAFVKFWKETGGELDMLNLTMGDDDLIAFGTFPSAMAAAEFSLGVSAGGFVSTTTSVAFDHTQIDEVARVLLHRHQTLVPEE